MGYYGGRVPRLVTGAGPVRGQGAARPDARPRQPPRMPLGALRAADDPRRTGRAASTWAGSRPSRPAMPSPTGRATSSSSSATIGPPTSSSSAPTTPGRPTTAGPATIRSTRIPRAARARGPTSASIAPTAARRSTTGVVNDPLTFGSGEFLPFEFPLAYWLEQHGYDVTYCSNSDMLTPRPGAEVQGVHQRRPRRILGHPAVPQRAGGCATRASTCCSCRATRSAGSPRFAPAATADRIGSSSAAVRTAARTTTRRRRQKEHGPFPEHGPDEGLLMGARNIEPVNGGGDWIVVKPEHWIFEGTGMKTGRPHSRPHRLGVPRRSGPASRASKSSPRAPPG